DRILDLRGHSIDPAFPVRGSLHDPALAVHDADHLSALPGPGKVALAPVSEPDGRPDRGLPGGLPGAPPGLAPDRDLAAGLHRPLSGRRRLLPAGRKSLRGYHLMSPPAIRVENLSKQYRIGAAQPRYRTFREAITDAAAAPLRRLSRVAGRGREARGRSPGRAGARSA